MYITETKSWTQFQILSLLFKLLLDTQDGEMIKPIRIKIEPES